MSQKADILLSAVRVLQFILILLKDKNKKPLVILNSKGLIGTLFVFQNYFSIT